MEDEMAENKKYGRQIGVSFCITLLVMVALVYGFGTYLIPRYQITQAQVYDVAVRLFPILLGLVMIQAGVVVAHRRDQDYADEVDRLPPNAYDKPLSELPNDDPSRLTQQGMPLQQPVVQPVAVKAENENAEAAPSPVEETPVSPTISVPAARQTVDFSFPAVLDGELENAKDMDYDLTLALANCSDEAVRDKVNEKLASLTEASAFPFTLEDGTEAMIFPFYNQDETQAVVSEADSALKEEFPEAQITYKYASRLGRVVSGDVLFSEAKG